MLRNPEVRRAVAAWVALTLAVAAGALAVAGPAILPWVLAASLAGALPHLAAARARYGRIARISERLDAVLHGERELDLDHMDEGELAILTSELDKMVQRLTRTADRLAADRCVLADALADISHQLRTPLTSLALTVELVRKELVRRGDAPAEVARLRQIERLLGRVSDLVEALLKLARLDAGQLRLARRPVDAAALVDAAVEPLAVALDIADVALVRDVEAGASYMGDAAWSAEALGNVIKNCMEHTPAGGRITVAVREDALACRITIEDTGPGIAEEDLPHIFERFYRGSGAGGTDAAPRLGADPSEVAPAGIGIGLSLARALATAQDGALTAENARDADGAVTGARFSFTFFKDPAI